MFHRSILAAATGLIATAAAKITIDLTGSRSGLTFDVTTGARDITVSNWKLRGATVSALLGAQLYFTTVSDDSELILNTKACP